MLKNVDGKYFTLEEYADHVKTLQTNKDNKVVYLYATKVDEQHSFIETAKERGYDVLVMDSPIDPHYINQLESKLKDTSFVRVDADTIEKLIKKEEAQPSKLSESEQNTLKPVIEDVVPKEKFMVVFESLSRGCHHDYHQTGVYEKNEGYERTWWWRNEFLRIHAGDV